MFDAVLAIFNVPSLAYWTTGALAILAGVLIHTMSSSQMVTFIFAPVLAIGGLAGAHVFQQVGIYVSPDKDSNVVVAAGAGMIVTLLALLVVTRLAFVLRDFSRPIELAGRTQDD